jgi:adenylate kinase family enzyme
VDKIVIIGSSGAGKSTLASNLGSLLQIKVFHLDRFFWGRYWQEKDSYTRKEILEKIVFRETRWIIEGSYLASSETALNEADTIIFLDLPPGLCLCRVIRRHCTPHETPRRDIPEGCTDRFSFFHLLKMVLFPFRRRKKVKQTVYNYRYKSIRLSSAKKVNDFLLSQETLEHTLLLAEDTILC